MEGATSAGTANDAATADPARRLLRVVLGMAALAHQRVGAILATSSAAAAPTPELLDVAPARRQAALGLLLEALEIAHRAPPALRARLSRATSGRRRFGPRLTGTRRLLGRAPGAAPLNRGLQRWRSGAKARLAAWTAAGLREETEARALAGAALITIREHAIARVAESPDLKQVIRDQSEGIAVTAVAELRERSAEADGLAEGAIGRLLGRRRRDGAP
jgi:hypothetical protein